MAKRKRNYKGKTLKQKARETIDAANTAVRLKERAVVLADVFDDEWFIYNHRPIVQEELQKLVKDALSLKCQNTRLGIVKRYRGQGKHWARNLGYIRETARGEEHYTCVFCEQNIATFGHGQGVHYLAPAFIDKLKRHIHECVVRYLYKPEPVTCGYEPCDGGPCLYPAEHALVKPVLETTTSKERPIS
jgi:hypothetical protein